MDDEKKIQDEGQEKKKDNVAMPFCTEAPSAEHARGSVEDEPCYDYREGK